MITFIGEESCKIDVKGRLLFPATYLRQLGEDRADSQSFVVRRSLHDPCLELYTLDEWESIVRKIRKKLGQFGKKQKQFMSQFMRGAAELRFDGSKRLLLPKRLLDELDISKDVRLLGSLNLIEIWKEETFIETQSSSDELSDLAVELLGNDFNLDDDE